MVVVDDDESVRESLPDLLTASGFEARAFSSPEEFLASESYDQAKCLVLDMAMPGMTGLDLQQKLEPRGHKIPIIFITGEKDESLCKRALERGASTGGWPPFGKASVRSTPASLNTN